MKADRRKGESVKTPEEMKKEKEKPLLFGQLMSRWL